MNRFLFLFSCIVILGALCACSKDSTDPAASNYSTSGVTTATQSTDSISAKGSITSQESSISNDSSNCPHTAVANDALAEPSSESGTTATTTTTTNTSVADPPTSACAHKNTVVRDTVPTACFKRGYSGNTYCEDCGVKLANGNIIEAPNHKPITLNAKEATATEDGFTGDVYCKNCGIKIADGCVIPKTSDPDDSN